MSDIGNILRHAREERGMSMGEFAEFLGVSKQNISLYESGRRSPKVTIAARIAEKLGLSIEQLAGISPVSESERVTDEKAEHLSFLLNQLTPDQRDEATRYIEYLLSKR